MKDNFKIYLISGKARHGKTTLAHYIKDYYNSVGKKCVATSFAKYIKLYACELTSWDGSEETKPRELLQQLGSEVIREKLKKNDFFVKRLHDDIDVYNLFADAAVIDDARLPLEIDYFKNIFKDKVVSIKIVRPHFQNNLSISEQNHMTEIGLDNYDLYDYTIVNDASLEELRIAAASFLENEV